MPDLRKGGRAAAAPARIEIDGTSRRYGSVGAVPLTVYHVPDLRPRIFGPWSGEADKIAWTDPATGMSCIIRRSVHGHLCGYVAVEPEHPLYGYEVGALPAEPALIVHDGVSYAQACEYGRPVAGSAWRKPPTPESPPAWWFGLECNHSLDYVPDRAPRIARAGPSGAYLFGAPASHPGLGGGSLGTTLHPHTRSASDANPDDAVGAGGLRTPVYRDEADVYRGCAVSRCNSTPSPGA